MLSDLQKRKLTKFFCMYDSNCDGVLVSQDFEALVKKIAVVRKIGGRSPKYIGLETTLKNTWKNLKQGADSSSDQKVSLDEWFAYYDAVLADTSRYEQEVKTLMSLVFELFDDNNDGKLSLKEWADLFSIYNISPLYAATVFQQLDANQDGVLDHAELLQLIHQFFYSDDPQSPANSMFGPY